MFQLCSLASILAHSESKFHGGLKDSDHQKPGDRFLFNT